MSTTFIICDQCHKEVKVDATGDFDFRLAVCDCGANLPFPKAEAKGCGANLPFSKAEAKRPLSLQP